MVEVHSDNEEADKLSPVTESTDNVLNSLAHKYHGIVETSEKIDTLCNDMDESFRELLGSFSSSDSSSDSKSSSDTGLLCALSGKRMAGECSGTIGQPIPYLLDSTGKSDYHWVSPEVTRISSIVNTPAAIEGVRSKVRLSSDGNESHVIAEACSDGEPVCLSRPIGAATPEFTYMYETLFVKLGVRMPFTPFECEVLREVNVAPTQLHPNSWGFMRAFQILCRALSMPPSVGRFFYFFQVKVGKKAGWISFNGAPGRGLLSVFISSYKNFKDKFFRIRASPSFPELLFDPNCGPRFPLYWTRDPVAITGAERFRMTPDEQDDVNFLVHFDTLSSAELIKLEQQKEENMKNYLARMSPMREDDMKAYYLKLREKKRAERTSQDAAAGTPTNESSATISEHLADAELHSDATEVPVNSPTHIPSSPTRAYEPSSSVPPSSTDNVQWRAILRDFDGSGSEVTSVWDRRFPLFDLVKEHFLKNKDKQKIRKIGLLNTGRAIQAYSMWCASMGAAIEEEFGDLEKSNKAQAKEIAVLKEKLADAKGETSKISTLKLELQSLRESIAKEREDWAIEKTKLKKLEDKKKKVAEDRLTKAMSDLEDERRAHQLTKNDVAQKDQQIEELKMEVVEKLSAGFDRAIEQVSLLHPGLELDSCDPFKRVVGGKLVD